MTTKYPIHTLIAACLSLALSIPTLAKTLDAEVIVIGAGAAGIASAHYLTKHNVKPIVLEARNRIGGRVWTFKDEAYNVDLGASWIHDADESPLLPLSEKYHLKTVLTNYDNFYAYNLYGKRIGKRVFDHFEHIFMNFLKAIDDDDDYEDISLMKAFRRYIQKEHLSKRDARILRFMLSLYIEHEDAADIDDLNTDENFYSFYKDEESEDRLFPNGYVSLLNALSNRLDIRLNEVVTEIDYQKEIIKVTTKTNVYNTHYVIVTVPLGVLKRKLIHFNPKLPFKKRRAIKSLNMGLLNKIYLRFDNVFWPKDKEFLIYVDLKKRFYTDIMNLYYYNHSPALILFTAAGNARRISKKSDETIIAEVTNILNIVSHGKAKNAKLLFYKITRWENDPYAFGSYSYSPNDSSGYEYEWLAESVKNKLFFAGEATSEDDSGTVSGAYETGLRAAKEVIDVKKQAMLPKTHEKHHLPLKLWF